MIFALPDEMNTAVSLGILLIASLFGGILADLLRIPRVTAYLLAGVVVGPSVGGLVSYEHMHHLIPLTKLAMALVLLELGTHFPLAQLRPILRHATWLSSGELLLTFIFVGLGIFLAGYGVATVVLLGALALATAPATTVLVLKESNSEGPVTELAGVLVALNNVAAIVAFELFFLIARFFSGVLSEHPSVELYRVAMDLGGATALGAVAGLWLSYGSGLLNQRRWLVLVLALSILLLGFCETWNLPYMLAFLVAGIVLVNTSDVADDLMKEHEKIAGLLVVVFFAVHGAELQLSSFVAAGSLGLLYIATRSAGKILGIRAASWFHREAPTVQRYLGPCLLAQAGAAIALASTCVERWPEVGERIQVVILGTVVFFEIAGPILIRWSVLRAGEVPLAQAISHRTETAASQAAKMWQRLREALGLSPHKNLEISKLRVADLIRKNVPAVPQSADFEAVVDVMRSSHDNTYVVVDEEKRIVGIIRYELLSDTFFDRQVDDLVRAEDLAVPPPAALALSEPLSVAVEAFRRTRDDILPVVTDDVPAKFIGVLRRSDLMQFLLVSRHQNSVDNQPAADFTT
ncbi:MAG: sodium/hydrogen exchanger [Pirellulaceae bacterium]|nr:MAG: sodium/hydrogen exchanger [Pirellulaceae bacterium]